MFAHRITQTAFVDEQIANASKVKGDTFGDAVFISVLRAVLPLHMADGEQLFVRVRSNDMRYEACEDRDVETVMSRVYGSMVSDNNALTAINLMNQRTIHSKVYAEFEEKFAGWKRVERVSKFFEQIFNVVCFINEEKKSVILVIGSANTANIHYLLCSMFAWFPWYFTKEKGVSEDEMALMQSLRSHTPDKFLEVLGRFEDKYDFYSMKLEDLTGFESQWMEREMANNNRRIESYMRDIESLRERLSECLKNKERIEINNMGIEAAIGKNENDSELRDYFINNKKRVRLVERYGDELTIEVMTNLTYWDPEYAETLYNNKRSILYTKRGSQPRIKSDQMGRLFKSIFIDNELKLHICAAYKLDVGECKVNGLAGYNYGTECAQFFPNPHIHEYHCLGGYAQALSQMMETHNYVGVLEQCVVSCQSINLTETPTMERFIPKFYGCNSPIIELPDGTAVTPLEAVEFLSARSKEEEENEQEN